MFDRLEDTVNRYEDITAELGNPDVVNDQEKFRKLMKEQSSLAPLIETYTEYKNCKKNIEDSLAILDEETDEELKEMAKEELNESKARVEELEHELKILLYLKTLMMIRILLLKSERVQVEKRRHFLQQSFTVCMCTMRRVVVGRLN